MKIDNEFSVSVPIELAWPALTDLAEVSLCLPGARLTGVENDVYSGEVRVKVGPVVSEYAGTAQFAEKDDATYRAVIDAKGRDSRGAGNASAQITMQLEADGLRTVVKVNTDLKITGKIAQLGGGMIAEVSQKLLGQFVECLEAKLAAPVPAELSDAAARSELPDAARSELSPDAPAGSEPPDPAARSELSPDETAAAEHGGNGPTPPMPKVSPPPEPRPAPEPLDLMSLAGGSLLKRLVPVLVILVVVAVVVFLIAR
jgi:carbon monoxide dehydrogenase subunit G